MTHTIFYLVHLNEPLMHARMQKLGVVFHRESGNTRSLHQSINSNYCSKFITVAKINAVAQLG